MADEYEFTPAHPMRIAVFISGTGTNMVAIINAIQAGELDAEIELVVSSNEKAKGIAKAREEALGPMITKTRKPSIPLLSICF